VFPAFAVSLEGDCQMPQQVRKGVMNKKIKWAAIIGVGIIVVVVAVVYIVLAAYDFNKFKPQIVDAVLKSTGRTLEIGGPVDVKAGLSPRLVLTDLAFQNAEWASRPQMVTLKRLEVQVALFPLLSNEIEIKRLILIEPDILIERDSKGRSNLSFKSSEQKPSEESAESKSTGPPLLEFNNVKIENGRLEYRDGASGKAYVVSLKELVAQADSPNSPMDLNVDGAYNNEPFAIQGEFGPLSQIMQASGEWALEVKVQMAGAELAVNGTAKNAPKGSLDMQLAAEVPEPGRLDAIVPGGFPVSQPVSLSGRAVQTGDRAYRISDLQVKLGDNDLTGTVEVDLNQTPMFVNADLASQKFDTRTLAKSKKATGKKEKASKNRSGKVFPNDPLPYDALKNVQGNIKLAAGKLILSGLVVNELKAECSIKDGRLVMKPFTAGIGGGKMTAEMSMAALKKDGELSLTVKADGVSLGQMFKEMKVPAFMTGVIDVDVSLEGQGKSVADVLAKSNGHTGLVLSGGQVSNGHIELLGAAISTSLFRMLNPLEKRPNVTRIRCGVINFRVKNGIAVSRAIVADTSSMTVVGEGIVNLRNEAMNISLKPVPKDGIAGFSLSPGQLAKAFRLQGRLTSPHLALDPKETALALGKAVRGGLVFGPAGVAAALLGSETGDKNPCINAIHAAEKGVRYTGGAAPGVFDKVTDTVTTGVKDTLDEAGDALKKIFK
jgi:uncharacterized protein involved in outer membrane biogenesis